MSAKEKNMIAAARKSVRALGESLRLASMELDPVFQKSMIKGCASDAQSLAKALGYKAPAKKKAPAKAKK
jgi:hypothetical protein|tara:strand:- start:743 stop:952 length:210 start_codon:yes stop_codon:yes gene_type:complete